MHVNAAYIIMNDSYLPCEASDEPSTTTLILKPRIEVRESSLTIRTTSGGVPIVSLSEYCIISKPTLTAVSTLGEGKEISDIEEQ